jgi:hypothetical protein
LQTDTRPGHKLTNTGSNRLTAIVPDRASYNKSVTRFPKRGSLKPRDRRDRTP